MESIVGSAYRVASREGPDQFELFGVRTRTLSLYVDDSAVKHIEEKIDQGLAVRVTEGNRPGQSSSSCSTMKEAEMTTMAAIRMAGLSPADSGFKQFPAGGMRSSVDPKVWDERIANMTGEQLVEISERIVESSTDGGGVKVPKGLIRVAKVESVIRNSNGVDVDRKNTLVYLNFTTMTDGSKPGEGVESFYSPHLSGLDPEAIGRSLREKALASSKTVAFKGRMKGNVIILPGELSEMLIHSAGSALSAENVHRKRSAWLGKVGEEVASRSITIVDDPSDGNGMLSSGYDDEGVPTSKKTLVDKGVLRSYLYDSYNAGLVSMEPSGNGVRRRPEDAQGIYLDPIGIWPMNLVLAPGRKGRADLISSVDEGVVIERVSDPEVNPITGAFGLEVRCGGLIRKGEVVQQIDRALLVGNMFEALSNVSDVASDSTVVKHCIVPTVCFDGIELIGGG